MTFSEKSHIKWNLINYNNLYLLYELHIMGLCLKFLPLADTHAYSRLQ